MANDAAINSDEKEFNEVCHIYFVSARKIKSGEYEITYSAYKLKVDENQHCKIVSASSIEEAKIKLIQQIKSEMNCSKISEIYDAKSGRYHGDLGVD